MLVVRWLTQCLSQAMLHLIGNLHWHASASLVHQCLGCKLLSQSSQSKSNSDPTTVGLLAE